MTDSSQRGFWSRLWQRRSWVQIASLVLTNSWFTREVTKGFPCLALNCYACPLAVTACPIGSIQHFVAIRQVPLYVLGVIGLAGALGGRFACGWLCPFGWLQEQIYKLPMLKGWFSSAGRSESAGRSVSAWSAPRWRVKPCTRARWWVLLLVSLPYAAGVWALQHYTAPATMPLGLYLAGGFVLYALLGASRTFALIGLVLFLPLFTGEPWFSKLCPAGMLEAGIPQVLIEPSLRGLVGSFYWLKMAILVLFIAWMAVTRRPFCRWICPLGAIWSPFNRVSTVRLTVDQEACVRCNRCQQVCPMDICVYEDANSESCIRCMQCINECPTSCIDLETLLGL